MMMTPVAMALMAMMAQAEAPSLSDFQAEIQDRLLEGLPAPSDTTRRLKAMPPAERIEALIFLRRSGMMTGRPWPLTDLLAPATPDSDDSEGPK